MRFALLVALAGAVAGCGSASEELPDACPDPNDPKVHYIADSDRDPSVCAGIRFRCTDSQTLFSNECGCGCIDD